jgi:hypothetical protein
VERSAVASIPSTNTRWKHRPPLVIPSAAEDLQYSGVFGKIAVCINFHADT